MIELRLRAPFTATDLAGFARLVRSFDPAASVDMDDGCLIAAAPTPAEWPRLVRGVVILEQERPGPGEPLRTGMKRLADAATAVQPDTEPEPEAATDRIEAARAAVDRSTKDIATTRAAKSHATRRVGEINTDAGTVAGQILRTLAAERGMWEDSLSELAREAWPTNPASAHPTARTMEKAGLIRCRREGRSVVAIELLAAGWDALGDDAGQYRGAPRGSAFGISIECSNAPAVTDLGSIERRPFDPDRLRDQAAGAL